VSFYRNQIRGKVASREWRGGRGERHWVRRPWKGNFCDGVKPQAWVRNGNVVIMTRETGGTGQKGRLERMEKFPPRKKNGINKAISSYSRKTVGEKGGLRRGGGFGGGGTVSRTRPPRNVVWGVQNMLVKCY